MNITYINKEMHCGLAKTGKVHRHASYGNEIASSIPGKP